MRKFEEGKRLEKEIKENLGSIGISI